MYIVGDSRQTFVADPLAINGCHIVTSMPHNCVNGRLITGFVGDRSKDMSNRVETQALPANDLLFVE